MLILDLKKIGEAISYTIPGRIVNTFILLITTIVLARMLGKDDYGLYLYIISIFAIITPFYNFGMDSAILRYASEYKTKGDLGKVKALVNKVIKTKFILWFIITFILLLAWDIFYPKTFHIAAIAAFVALLGNLETTFGSALESFYKQKFGILVGTTLNVMRFLLIFAVLYFIPSIEMVILIGVIPSLISVSLFRSKLKKETDVKTTDIESDVPRIAKYSISMMVLTLLNYIVWRKSEIIFLGMFRSTAEVATYGIAYSMSQRIAEFIVLGIGGLGIVSATDIYAQNPMKLRYAIKKMEKFIALLIIPISIWSFIESPNLILLVYGQEFLDAVVPFKILMVIMTITVLVNAMSIAINVLEKTVSSVKILFFLATINIALDILFIPTYGIFGAIGAATITLMLNFIIYTLWINKLIGNVIPFRNIVKFIISASPMSIILATTSYNNNLLYIAFFSLAGFTAYILMLKLTKAISDRDKEIICKMKLPFIQRIIKLL